MVEQRSGNFKMHIVSRYFNKNYFVIIVYIETLHELQDQRYVVKNITPIVHAFKLDKSPIPVHSIDQWIESLTPNDACFKTVSYAIMINLSTVFTCPTCPCNLYTYYAITSNKDKKTQYIGLIVGMVYLTRQINMIESSNSRKKAIPSEI